MITFFTTGKPFKGHDGIIQRNALQSWKALHPDVEVILFGDEEGAAQACAEYGLRHEPRVERYQGKIPYINFMFARAQQIARHEYLCYCNCDIILLGDFLRAFEKARKWRKGFLMVSRRWDTDIAQPINFGELDWAGKLRRFARRHGSRRDEYWIDFFLFPRGLYVDMPALVVGYCYWDNWMIWRTLFMGLPVLDGSPVLVPVHQNHGYSPESERTKGVPTDARSLRNLELIGGERNIANIEASTHRMSRMGWICPSGYRYRRGLRQAARVMRFDVWHPIWFSFLDATRTVRHSIGLKRGAMREFLHRKPRRHWMD